MTFNVGVIKLDHKSKTRTGINLNVNGSQKIDSGEVNAFLEGKYTIKDHGITFREKWTTNSVLTGEITLEDGLCKGLKKVIEFNFEPNTGKKTAKVKINYKRQYLNSNVDIDFPSQKPIITSALVLGCTPELGYLGGAQVTYDTLNNKWQKLSYGLGIKRREFELTGMVNNNNEVSFAAFQKLKDNIETGVQCSYNVSNQTTKFVMGLQYYLDNKSFFKARVDNKSMIGLAYGFHIRDGIQLILGAHVDGKNLDGGKHQVGASLEFEA